MPLRREPRVLRREHLGGRVLVRGTGDDGNARGAKRACGGEIDVRGNRSPPQKSARSTCTLRALEPSRDGGDALRKAERGEAGDAPLE